MIDLEQLLARRRISPGEWISNLCSENQLNSMEDFKNWEKNNTQYKIGETLKLVAEQFFQTNSETNRKDTVNVVDYSIATITTTKVKAETEEVEKDDKSTESQIHSSKKRKSKPVEEESES